MTTSTYTTTTGSTSAYSFPTASFVGFNQVLEDFYRIQPTQTNYPPHNVVELDADNFVIELAVAGFTEEEIDVQVKDSLLKITGEKKEDDDRKYAHKGISSRDFVKAFTLGEYVEVKEAILQDGILAVYLERVVPEEKRPRKIAINNGAPKKATILNG